MDFLTHQLERRNIHAEQERSELYSEIVHLRGYIYHLHTRLKELTGKTHTIPQRVEGVGGATDADSVMVELTRQALERQQMQHSHELRALGQKHDEEISRRKREIQELQALLQEHRTDDDAGVQQYLRTRLVEESAKWQIQVLGLEQELQTLAVKHKEGVDRVFDLQSQLQDLEGKLSTAEKDGTDLKTQTRLLQSRVRELESLIAEMARDERRGTWALERTDSLYAMKDAEVAQLVEQRRSLLVQNEVLRTDLHEVHTVRGKQDYRLSILQNQVDELQRQRTQGGEQAEGVTESHTPYQPTSPGLRTPRTPRLHRASAGSSISFAAVLATESSETPDGDDTVICMTTGTNTSPTMEEEARDREECGRLRQITSEQELRLESLQARCRQMQKEIEDAGTLIGQKDAEIGRLRRQCARQLRLHTQPVTIVSEPGGQSPKSPAGPTFTQQSSITVARTQRKDTPLSTAPIPRVSLASDRPPSGVSPARVLSTSPSETVRQAVQTPRQQLHSTASHVAITTILAPAAMPPRQHLVPHSSGQSGGGRTRSKRTEQNVCMLCNASVSNAALPFCNSCMTTMISVASTGPEDLPVQSKPRASGAAVEVHPKEQSSQQSGYGLTGRATTTMEEHEMAIESSSPQPGIISLKETTFRDESQRTRIAPEAHGTAVADEPEGMNVEPHDAQNMRSEEQVFTIDQMYNVASWVQSTTRVFAKLLALLQSLVSQHGAVLQQRAQWDWKTCRLVHLGKKAPWHKFARVVCANQKARLLSQEALVYTRAIPQVQLLVASLLRSTSASTGVTLAVPHFGLETVAADLAFLEDFSGAAARYLSIPSIPSSSVPYYQLHPPVPPPPPINLHETHTQAPRKLAVPSVVAPQLDIEAASPPRGFISDTPPTASLPPISSASEVVRIHSVAVEEMTRPQRIAARPGLQPTPHSGAVPRRRILGSFGNSADESPPRDPERSLLARAAMTGDGKRRPHNPRCTVHSNIISPPLDAVLQEYLDDPINPTTLMEKKKRLLNGR
eukprot:TRINITY_DN7990_c0_g1_i1.p1 TRINITY_DN7990_c0_g1~~TRINITY_DN7990_c0_g1_i1.p1  ORF type:complete len:1150 (+),score=142.13 TRINITY_DN7990_c0_g1_i1:396-3452(+)